MDPPLFSEGSFSTSNPSLAEIWPFNTGGGGMGAAIGDANGLLGLRIAGGGFGLGGGFVDGGPSMNHHRDGSIEESTVTDQSGGGCHGGGASGRKRREIGSEDESSKLPSTTSGNELNTIGGKRMRTSGSNEHNATGSKPGGETSSNGGGKSSDKKNNSSSNNQPGSSEPPKDYIHVRARRGQATDSHSLAERARREKISERMKILQDLVPGCNKVIGKALVLDEIINYIQSLQRQVEFLSMKLEAVNSGINPVISAFPPKDLGPISFDATGMIYGPQAAREFESGRHPDWLHMHLGAAGGGSGGGFERTA